MRKSVIIAFVVCLAGVANASLSSELVTAWVARSTHAQRAAAVASAITTYVESLAVPKTAEYIVGAADGTLTAERVCTDTLSIDCDMGTGGQAKFNVLAVTDAMVPDTITVTNATHAVDATVCDELIVDPANCAGNEFALGIEANGDSECAQPAFANLSGAATDAQVPNDITVTLAATTTALAENGTNCSAGSYPLGVDAEGNVEDCTAAGEGGGVEDGDKGDITVSSSGTAWNIDAGAVGDAEAGDLAVAGDVDGTIGALDIDEAACEAELESVIDLPDLQGILTGAKGGVGVALPTCSGTDKLTANGTQVSCAADQTGAGGVTTLTSSGTQSDADIATYTAITGLSFTPAASTNYRMDCFIIYTSTAATTGINFAWDVPASVTSIHMTGYTTTTAVGAIQGFIQRADNAGTPTSAAIITTEQVAFLSARLRNGANATAATLGFTPETANSVSVIAGSTCAVWSY